MSIFDDASSIMNAALHAALPDTAEGILYVFLVFQTEEVGEKTAAARRHNCAVLP